MPFPAAITGDSALRVLYREPHELVVRKQIDRVDAAARSFIAASPFFVLATSHPGGADASPRGGPPGFVTVLEEHRLVFGDLSGNNRLDSLTNLLLEPNVGLVFLVPGVDETLRVNGRATLTTDPDILHATTVDGRAPRLAVGIDVDECFIHCAKAFRRSRLWDPASWPTGDDRPSAACVLRDHLGLDVDAAVIEADLEVAYRTTLWEPGG